MDLAEVGWLNIARASAASQFAMIQPRPCKIHLPSITPAHGGRRGMQMFLARQYACAATASLLIAGGFIGSFLSAVHARAEGSSATCQDAAGIAVLPAPIAPWRGAPLRVLFAADKPLDGELSLIAPNGSIAAKSRDRNGGPPYFWFAEVAVPAAGTWRATLVLERMSAECHTITREIAVSAQKPPPHSAAGSVWPLRHTWSRATEDLYSAWIAKLFDAPLDAELSWPALHLVLRDRSRNLLFNYLGLGEDDYAMPAGKSVAEVKAELQSVLASEFAARKFSYTRSDGFAWTITLKDVVERAADLEMGYNPNDCVEVRWGAPADSEETSTCKGHAPQAQRAKMLEYRNWFRERHWPHA